MYTVTGYINNQNQVTKVETRVEHAVVGDLLVEFEYSNYKAMNGVQVPGRIVQKQAGLETFNADITAATPNPSNLTELLTPPPPPAGRAGGPGGGGWWRWSRAAAGRAACREARRRRLQDRRQLRLARRRHGRSHPRDRERPERCARHGGDGGREAGDPQQADPLRRELASALRSRERTRRGGGRRRDDPDPREQRESARTAPERPAHADSATACRK